MKKLIICLLMIIVAVVFGTDTSKSEEKKSTNIEAIAYDSILAEKLGADQYGMRSYVIAFLKPGPNRDQDSTTAVNLQKAHRANINRLADEGKLVLAGPFLDGGDIAGIFIFNVATVEEAKILTESDPAIQAGRLIMELRPWYGSAALMQVNEVHKKLKK